LLALLYFAAVRWLADRTLLPPVWIPLGAGAVVALCGYATFWAYFAHPLLGKTMSWSLLAVGAFFSLRPGRMGPCPEVSKAAKLLLVIGGLHLGLLHLFPTSHDFFTLAANRYREGMPADNVLSHAFAERLFAGQPAKNPADEWQSSDRPPLQAGWQLLTWPATKLLSLDARTASGTSAVWFQLLWVAAAYGLLRTLGVSARRTAGWLAVCALAGFFLQNTVFTWPKLSAGAFVCGAFALWVLVRSNDPRTRRNAILAGAALAVLGWLSHGGVAFSLLPLGPWIVWRMFRGEARWWLGAAGVFLLFALPWFAYQKLYDPPGDWLLKWHLAGEGTRDNTRSVWQAIREAYQPIPWRQVWATKSINLRLQLEGDFAGLFSAAKETRAERREDEFFHTIRGLTWWPVLALLALVITPRRIFTRDRGELNLTVVWTLLSLAVASLALFGLNQAVIHHSSYAHMIALFVLCSVVLERAGPRWLGLLAVLQVFTLVTTWAVSNPTIRGPMAGLPVVLAFALVLAWFLVRASRAEPEEGPEPAANTPRLLDRIATWWQNPQLNAWVLLTLAALLFLRKPHGLHTPQLWAEDGTIFLLQNETEGFGAWFLPYMGYLHLLPRLIAFAGSLLVDPAWWPLFYNGVSFLIWLVVLGRLFSPRLDLPGKPWLVLAFFLGPNTGEVLFNITNLQWLTAFVLLQQVLIARPTNYTERFTDVVFTALAGLTGVFIVIFAPLFAWRWWNEWRADRQENLRLAGSRPAETRITAFFKTRTWDATVILALAAACAATQAWFVIRTGPKFEYQSAPFHLLDAINVIARRLLVWPMVGDKLALSIPPRVIGLAGGLFIAALLGWALRPDPRRRLRAIIVAAFALIMLACMHRTRPDTWAADNLYFGDRYFYIPRVLLAWLLIWEFHAVPRAIAYIARITCLLAVVVNLRDYQIPAPPDYHWADHVEPIRRGQDADIPTLPENWTLEYRPRHPGG
jgi:hypothetical protein